MSHRLAVLGVDGRIFWSLVAVLVAIVTGRTLKWVGSRLDQRRPSEERELMQLRSRETMIVLVATAIPYATAIVVLIVLASFFSPAAALGGSAFLAVIVGFAAQRFLMDVVAGGALIAFERWYAVGDFVMIEPSKAAGIVEQFGLRTTVLRALNGDRAYVPNSQIITAFWSPSGYRRYSIELLTTEPDEVERAIEEVGRRGPAGHARFLRPPRVVETRELEGGTWLVRGVVDVAPTMEWLAEDLLVGALKAQLRSDVLLSDPLVYTLDEGTLSRYERRVLIK
jgi:moderate conductance mechanosensitive channel